MLLRALSLDGPDRDLRLAAFWNSRCQLAKQKRVPPSKYLD